MIYRELEAFAQALKNPIFNKDKFPKEYKKPWKL
jgi:hypothetical protein